MRAALIVAGLGLVAVGAVVYAYTVVVNVLDQLDDVDEP